MKIFFSNKNLPKNIRKVLTSATALSLAMVMSSCVFAMDPPEKPSNLHKKRQEEFGYFNKTVSTSRGPVSPIQEKEPGKGNPSFAKIAFGEGANLRTLYAQDVEIDALNYARKHFDVICCDADWTKFLIFKGKAPKQRLDESSPVDRINSLFAEDGKLKAKWRPYFTEGKPPKEIQRVIVEPSQTKK